MNGWYYFSSVRVKGKRVVLSEHVVKKYGINRDDVERLEKLAVRIGSIIASPYECFRESIAPRRFVAVRKTGDRYTIVVYEENKELYIVTMVENISAKRYKRMKKNRLRSKRWVKI